MNLAFLQVTEKRNFSLAKKFLQKASSLSKLASDQSMAKASFAKALLEAGEKNFDQALEHAKQAYFLGVKESEDLVFRILGEEKSRGLLTKIKDKVLIQKGDEWRRKEEFHEALTFYERAFLQKGSQRGEAAFRAALCLWEMNLRDQSMKWFEKTLKQDPYHIEAYVFLSRYYKERKNFISAEKILAKAYNLRPGHHEIFRAYAEVEKKRGNLVSAIQYAEEALKTFSMDLETYPVLVTSLLQQEKYNEAYRYAARALEVNPYFPFVHVMYAEALGSLYGLEAALSHLRPLMEKHPSEVKFLFIYARLLKENGRFREASYYFSQLLSLKPRFKKAYLEYGEMYKKRKSWKKALEIFFKGLSFDPLSLEILNEIASVYKEKKNFREAKKYFQKILNTNPNYPFVHYQMGKMALEMRDFSSALKHAKKERKLNSEFIEAYILSAESYRKMKQYNLCFDEYQKAVEKGSKDSHVYVKMAECSRLSGGIDVALSLLNRANALESGNPFVHRELGLVYEAKGQWKLASKAYRNYLILAPQAKDRALIERKISRRETDQP